MISLLINLFLSISYFSSTFQCEVEKDKIKSLISIEIVNFPSRDTAFISFNHVSDNWIKITGFRQFGRVADTTQCSECKEIFKHNFIDSLLTLQNEKIAKDCRSNKDTVIDGKLINEVQDFYNSSDLQTEIISIKLVQKAYTVSYIEPRTAILFCKDNMERFKFIRISETLRKID